MDFKSLISKLDSMEAPPQTPAAPVLEKAVQLTEDAQLRVLSGRSTYVAEAKIKADEDVKKEKSSTGGTIDRSKPGVTTHTQNPDSDNAAPDSHAEPASNAKAKNARERAAQTPALQQSKTGTWGMKGGEKFDNTKKESIEPEFKSKFMKMVEAAKEGSEADNAAAAAAAKDKLKKKKEKMAKIMDEGIEEGEKKCPPMSQIKKMCQDGMSVAEICKKHPDCNQKELKQMVADCKSKLNEAKKPDDDNDGVPDWADEKKGEDDNAGKKTSGKKGMSAAQAKYFGKKKTVKESIENILSFKDMIKLVQESGGQQQIDAVDQELFAWAQRVAKQKIGEGLKADVYAGMVYERMGGVFEMYDVLSEDQK